MPWTFLAALRAGDLWAKCVLIGAGLAAFMVFAGWQVHAIKRGAVLEERAKIERANTQSMDAANKGQQPVQECAGKWNRSTGKCER